MAKDILYISNGVDINPLWTNSIAISGDGVNWDSISKHAINGVGSHSLSLNKTAPNSYPERNKDTAFYVDIQYLNKETSSLKFNPSKVINQPAWTVGNPAVNAQVAVADILNWLG